MTKGKTASHLTLYDAIFLWDTPRMTTEQPSSIGRPRCTGHCCRGFALEQSYEEVWKDYDRWRSDPSASAIPDVHLIAPMLIPIKELRGEWLYTCKHLRKTGDCGIYEHRPRMCREFPGEHRPCPFPICSSHGRRNPIARAIAWLRT